MESFQGIIWQKGNLRLKKESTKSGLGYNSAKKVRLRVEKEFKPCRE